MTAAVSSAAAPAPVSIVRRTIAVITARFLWLFASWAALQYGVLAAGKMPLHSEFLENFAQWCGGSQPLCVMALIFLPVFLLGYVWLRRQDQRFIKEVVPVNSRWQSVMLSLSRIPILAAFVRPFFCWHLVSGYLPRRLLVLQAFAPIVFYYTLCEKKNGWQMLLGHGVWLAIVAIPLLWAVLGFINDVNIREKTALPETAWREWRNIVFPAVAVILFLAAVLIIPAQLMLGRTAAAAAAAARPVLAETTLADLQRRFPPLPPAFNAARFYRPLFPTALAAVKEAPDCSPQQPADAEKLGVFVASRHELYAAIDAAAAIPAANFGYRYSLDGLPGGRLDANAAGFRALFTLQQWRFYAALHRRDIAAADKVWLAMGALIRHHADTLATNGKAAAVGYALAMEQMLVQRQKTAGLAPEALPENLKNAFHSVKTAAQTAAAENWRFAPFFFNLPEEEKLRIWHEGYADKIFPAGVWFTYDGMRAYAQICSRLADAAANETAPDDVFDGLLRLPFSAKSAYAAFTGLNPWRPLPQP